MINIRPHHLLCMHGFRGKGYNQEFVESMTNIVNKIKENKDINLNVINGTDAICLKCPNKMDKNLCVTQENIEALDQQVVEVLDLTERDYSYRDILGIIKDKLTETNFEKICSDCEWYDLGYCKDGLFMNEGC